MTKKHLNKSNTQRLLHHPFSIIVGLLLSAFLFTGCGGSGDNSRDAGGTGVTTHAVEGQALFTEQTDHSGILISLENEATPGQIAHQTSTDGAGNFGFSSVETGNYVLYASSADSIEKMVSRSIKVSNRHSAAIVDIVLTAAGTLSGSVTLSDAADHRGTLIYLDGTGYSAHTNTLGDFSLANVPVGIYDLTMSHDGYESNSVTDVNITVGGGASVPAAVLSASGETTVLNSLVSVTAISAEGGCATGQKIESGLDDNGDSVLEAGEVDKAVYVCDGLDGSSGSIGLDGSPGNDGLDGSPGSAGINSLVSVTAISAEGGCATGQKIESGLDDNGDSVLEAEEVDKAVYVCDGLDGSSGSIGLDGSPGNDGLDGSPGSAGLNSLVSVTAISAKGGCATGQKIESGLDVNDDTVLDVGEVVQTDYVCDGIDGADGVNSLIAITEETPGVNCTYGGKRIDSGLDDNANGILEVGEYDLAAAEYLCTTDPLPLEVVYTMPANGQLGVNTTHSLTAILNNTIDPSTLTSSSFTLFNGANQIAGDISFNGETVSFIPEGGINYGTTYTATLTTDLADVAEHNLASNYTWNFDTTPVTGARAISSGENHTCMLTEAGQVKCWGRNDYGQLGLGHRRVIGDDDTETGDNLPFVDLGTGQTAIAIASGSRHNCVIIGTPGDVTGDVKCWGYGGAGTLGYSNANNLGDHPDEMGDNLPIVNLGTGRSAKSIVGGHYSTCAILDDDSLKCWGSNLNGKLGIGAAGNVGDQVDEMGDNLPTIDLGTGRAALKVNMSTYNICALLDNGDVKCWGGNHYGALGQDSSDDSLYYGDSTSDMGDSLMAVNLGTNRTAVDIALGESSVCAILDTTGDVKCWGRNQYGRLGQGDTVNRGGNAGDMAALASFDLGTGRSAKSISGQNYFYCAILDDDSLKCWGFGHYGNLGQGVGGSSGNIGDGVSEMGDNLPAIDVGANRTVIQVETGNYHTCALLDNKEVRCWGSNSGGLLGTGNGITLGDDADEMGDKLQSVNPGPLAGVLKIASGENFSCALMETGVVKCWGDSQYGQTGQGNTVPKGDDPGEMGSNLTALDLGTDLTAADIAMGGMHACALLSDSTVKCWGRNNAGQLGQEDNEDRGDEGGEMGTALLNIYLGTGVTPTSIATGGVHTCAIVHDGTSDGHVKCWGNASFGQLGYENTEYYGRTVDTMGDNLPTVDLGTNRTALAIGAGYLHTCALLDDGSVKCWGFNNYGQLGQGHLIEKVGDGAGEMGDNLPVVELGTGRTATALRVGTNHNCAILDDDTVKCWGHNGSGQLGQGHTNNIGDATSDMGNALNPVSLGTGLTVQDVFTGANHVCAQFTDNRLKCWGEGSQGALGSGSVPDLGKTTSTMGNNLPFVDLGSNLSVKKLASGSSMALASCVILNTVHVKCWGNNAFGGLGLGDVEVRGNEANEMGNYLPIVNLK
ncbi:MAG: hypothetical protein GY866_27100 [Proteobacteria bacterium]|nr:hypothetical protein [Pseudomonadota bacterium]